MRSTEIGRFQPPVRACACSSSARLLSLANGLARMTMLPPIQRKITMVCPHSNDGDVSDRQLMMCKDNVLRV